MNNILLDLDNDKYSEYNVRFINNRRVRFVHYRNGGYGYMGNKNIRSFSISVIEDLDELYMLGIGNSELYSNNMFSLRFYYEINKDRLFLESIGLKYLYYFNNSGDYKVLYFDFDKEYICWIWDKIENNNSLTLEHMLSNIIRVLLREDSVENFDKVLIQYGGIFFIKVGFKNIFDIFKTTYNEFKIIYGDINDDNRKTFYISLYKNIFNYKVR